MATDGTGGGNTYFVTLLGATATVTELKNGSNASFGSYDIAYKDGLVYVPVPDYSNYPLVSNLVYIFDESGTQKSYSPVPVMSSSDAISNIGFYE